MGDTLIASSSFPSSQEKAQEDLGILVELVSKLSAKKRDHRSAWTTEEKLLLLQEKSKIPEQSWDTIARILNRQFSKARTGNACKEHYSKLKGASDLLAILPPYTPADSPPRYSLLDLTNQGPNLNSDWFKFSFEAIQVKNGDINQRNTLGFTPLHFIARMSSLKDSNDKEQAKGNYLSLLREILERHDVQVNAQEKNGKTPFLLACFHDFREAVNVFLGDGRVDINTADCEGCTPLWYAANFGHFEIVKKILESGMKPDLAKKGRAGRYACTAEVIANRRGHTAIVELLRGFNESSIKLRPKLRRPEFPIKLRLYIAAKLGDAEEVESLLNQSDKSILDERNLNEKGHTALDVACENGHLDVVGLLLQRDLNVNTLGELNCTPILHACKNGNREIVELLLEKNVDVEIADKDGHTPLWWASRNGFDKVVDCMVQWNKGEVKAKVVKCLGIRGFDYEEKRYFTPIEVATAKKHEKVKDILETFAKSKKHPSMTINETATTKTEMEASEALKELKKKFPAQYDLLDEELGGSLDEELRKRQLAFPTLFASFENDEESLFEGLREILPEMHTSLNEQVPKADWFEAFQKHSGPFSMIGVRNIPGMNILDVVKLKIQSGQDCTLALPNAWTPTFHTSYKDSEGIRGDLEELIRFVFQNHHSNGKISIMREQIPKFQIVFGSTVVTYALSFGFQVSDSVPIVIEDELLAQECNKELDPRISECILSKREAGVLLTRSKPPIFQKYGESPTEYANRVVTFCSDPKNEQQQILGCGIRYPEFWHSDEVVLSIAADSSEFRVTFDWARNNIPGISLALVGSGSENRLNMGSRIDLCTGMQNGVPLGSVGTLGYYLRDRTQTLFAVTAAHLLLPFVDKVPVTSGGGTQAIGTVEVANHHHDTYNRTSSVGNPSKDHMFINVAQGYQVSEEMGLARPQEIDSPGRHFNRFKVVTKDGVFNGKASDIVSQLRFKLFDAFQNQDIFYCKVLTASCGDANFASPGQSGSVLLGESTPLFGEDPPLILGILSKEQLEPIKNSNGEASVYRKMNPPTAVFIPGSTIQGSLPHTKGWMNGSL